MTLYFAGFSHPERPVVLLAGDGADALVRDGTRLFATLDFVGLLHHDAPATRVRVVSVTGGALAVLAADESDPVARRFSSMAALLESDLGTAPTRASPVDRLFARPPIVAAPLDPRPLPGPYAELRFGADGAAPCAEGSLTHAEAVAAIGLGDRARAMLERALTRAGEDARALRDVGLAAARCEQAAVCREAFERAVEKDPRDVRSWLDLARACSAMRDRPAAIRAARKAVERDLGSREARVLLQTLVGQESWGERLRRWFGRG